MEMEELARSNFVCLCDNGRSSGGRCDPPQPTIILLEWNDELVGEEHFVDEYGCTQMDRWMMWKFI